jgi:hypothetical protein
MLVEVKIPKQTKSNQYNEVKEGNKTENAKNGNKTNLGLSDSNHLIHGKYFKMYSKVDSFFRIGFVTLF